VENAKISEFRKITDQQAVFDRLMMGWRNIHDKLRLGRQVIRQSSSTVPSRALYLVNDCLKGPGQSSEPGKTNGNNSGPEKSSSEDVHRHLDELKKGEKRE